MGMSDDASAATAATHAPAAEGADAAEFQRGQRTLRPVGAKQLRVDAARHPGRSHRRLGTPCQDAHAQWVDPVGQRAVAAVADGLGSCPLSQVGSQAAADAAVAALAAEPAWDEAALVRAFAAARAAVEAEAERAGAPVHDLATTLQVACRDGGVVLAGMVGDGAVVCGRTVLLAPAPGGYANEVVPITAGAWQDHLQVARHENPGAGARARAEGAGAGAPDPVLLFSDGLIRLLLARDGATWTPFAPFFDRFLPALAADPDGTLVERFVHGDDVDRAWDDDKCLAVIRAC